MKIIDELGELLTSIFEKQIAIRELADQLANEFDDIKEGDRSKAVAIVDLANKQQDHLNELENKLDSLSPPSQEETKTDQPAWMSFPVEEMEKLTQEDVDFALRVQALDEDARNSVIASMDALIRRRTRGDDVDPKGLRKLIHPAWYNHKPGDEINDLSLTDSLNMYFHEMVAISDLMMSADKQDLSEHTITYVASMLMDQAREAENLVDQWHEQHGNVT